MFYCCVCVCAHARICVHARLYIHHSVFVAVRGLAGTGWALLYLGPWDQTHMVRPVTSISTSWEISLTPGCLLTAMRTSSYSRWYVFTLSTDSDPFPCKAVALPLGYNPRPFLKSFNSRGVCFFIHLLTYFRQSCYIAQVSPKLTVLLVLLLICQHSKTGFRKQRYLKESVHKNVY